jgi:alpha-galactosidase
MDRQTPGSVSSRGCRRISRRGFLKGCAGCVAASAGLVGAAESDADSDAMALPNEVTAQTEKEKLSLLSTDRQAWTGNAVEVRLQRTGASLSILIQSPEESLRSVTLVWKHATAPTAVYLGDAWERAYGGLGWQKLDPDRVMPWYVMEHDGAATRGFGVKTGCRAMCYWQAGNGLLKLVVDTRSGGRGVRLDQRILTAAEIVTRKSRPGESPFQATQAFCRRMCEKPRLPRRLMVGSLDWYYTYGKSTDKLFVDEAALFAKLVDGCGVKAFALVDAGWAPGDRSCWHDDQTRSHPDFGSIQEVATKVRALGLAPGLWTRPLCTSPKDPEEIRLSRDRKLLDPSLPQNLERIRDLMPAVPPVGLRSDQT